MNEIINAFINMCVVTETGSNYLFFLTNTFSKDSYALQISKQLFEKALKERAVWNEEPYIVSDKTKEPEGMTL